MTNLAEELKHLKHHVNYRADRQQVVAACSNMMDVPAKDRDWFVKVLPEGNYRTADEVVSALLRKL